MALNTFESVLMVIQAGSSHTFLLCRAISVLMPSVNGSALTPVTMGSCSYLALGAHKLSPQFVMGGWQGKVCLALWTLSGAVWAEEAMLAD